MNLNSREANQSEKWIFHSKVFSSEFINKIIFFIKSIFIPKGYHTFHCSDSLVPGLFLCACKFYIKEYSKSKNRKKK